MSRDRRGSTAPTPTSGCPDRGRTAAPSLLVLLWTLLSGLLLSLPAGAALYRVDGTVGTDGPGCGSQAQPCATIQQAVDLAVSGDSIFVAAGTYTGSATCLGEATVVCIHDKELTLLGGFAGGIWTSRDPALNTTTIDGENLRRALIARRAGVAPLPAASLRLEGFTIRNGAAQGAGHQFGGGLKVLLADAVLRDLVITDNSATSQDALAGGGGAAIQGHPDLQVTATLERLTFTGNQAQAGPGQAGLGGGLHLDHVDATAFDLTLTGNEIFGGAAADALGGGMSMSLGTDAYLERITVEDNLSRAGDGVSQGGASFGGGLYIEAESTDAAELDLVDAELRRNTSRGGDGPTAGNGSGGGLMSFGGQVTVDRVEVVDNSAEGGNAGAGPSGGGGVYTSLDFSTLSIRNTVIADNQVSGLAGGGGAGLRLLGASATVSHTTFADNRSLGNSFGLAVLAGPLGSTPSDVTLEYSIVADHVATAGERAIHLQDTGTGTSTGTFSRNLFAGNTTDSNEGEVNSGTYSGWPGDNIFSGSSPTTFFVDPATFDYHITNAIPPRNEAPGSTEATDLNGASRTLDLPRDIGADEYDQVGHRLTVRKEGIGTGAVTGSLAGIDCGADCTEVYGDGDVVVLTAVADPGFGFAAFTGDPDCSDGSVTMTAERLCVADFSAQTTQGTLVIEKVTVPAGRPESFQFTGVLPIFLGDGEQHVEAGLEPDPYAVVETDHPLFHLDSIVCDDPDSSGDVGTGTATYRLDPGQTVTCTFTNVLTSCSAPQDDLVLPDESVDDTRLIQACSTITGGPYNIEGTGDVTLESLAAVFRDDFSVETGGSLTVILNVP